MQQIIQTFSARQKKRVLRKCERFVGLPFRTYGYTKIRTNGQGRTDKVISKGRFAPESICIINVLCTQNIESQKGWRKAVPEAVVLNKAVTEAEVLNKAVPDSVIF